MNNLYTIVPCEKIIIKSIGIGAVPGLNIRPHQSISKHKTGLFLLQMNIHRQSIALTGSSQRTDTIVSLQNFYFRHHTCRKIANTQLGRSEEHTSELQSRGHLVCRLLLVKKSYYTTI